MNNIFELKFDKATTRLAGNPYGKSEFEKQIGNSIDYSGKITVIFPNQIERVASSFVQGFFNKIIETIGYEGFEANVEIKAKNEALEAEIREKIH